MSTSNLALTNLANKAKTMRPNKYTKFVFVYFVLGDFMVPKTFAGKPSASKKHFTSYIGGFKENVSK